MSDYSRVATAYASGFSRSRREALAVALGTVSPHAAWEQTRSLPPVVVFLALILVLARLCADEGLFEAAGNAVARWCGGSPRWLLAGVFAVAAAIAAVLSLDATVVLLTPVVFATAARAWARARPHVYAAPPTWRTPPPCCCRSPT